MKIFDWWFKRKCTITLLSKEEQSILLYEIKKEKERWENKIYSLKMDINNNYKTKDHLWNTAQQMLRWLQNDSSISIKIYKDSIKEREKYKYIKSTTFICMYRQFYKDILKLEYSIYGYNPKEEKEILEYIKTVAENYEL